MKQPSVLFKSSALVSSIVLIGGMIGCRTGAFNKPPRDESLSKDALLTPPPKLEVKPKTDTPTFMPGSKSLSPLPWNEMMPQAQKTSTP